MGVWVVLSRHLHPHLCCATFYAALGSEREMLDFEAISPANAMLFGQHADGCSSFYIMGSAPTHTFSISTKKIPLPKLFPPLNYFQS